jgi:hypothetical protein
MTIRCIPHLIVALGALALSTGSVAHAAMAAEALGEANRYFASILLQCQESWFLTDGAKENVTGVTEFYDPLVTIRPQRRTDIDRLNRLAWKGEFVLLASAFRRYHFQQQEWEEWAEAADKRALVVPAEQRGGQWRMGRLTSEVVNLQEPLLRLETFTCERMTVHPPGP